MIQVPHKNGLVDTRVDGYVPLISPYQLWQEIPRSERATETVMRGRYGIEQILDNKDNRIFFIVGTCSIHDPLADMEYALLLKELADEVSDRILIVKRSYFEKSRTGPSWEGFIVDPYLNGSDDVNAGYRLSRRILMETNELGLPCATEFLERDTPQYIGDGVSWAAIGARTSSSPQHRKMASGLSMPVGIKNDTHGDIAIAVNGVRYAMQKRSFLGKDPDGHDAIVKTRGNPYAHLVLRGGDESPNYDRESVRLAQSMLEGQGLLPNVVIDCSHGNSGKDYTKQSEVCEEIVRQIRDGNHGIVGIMYESNLKAGSQKIPDDLEGFDTSTLRHGVSVTDGCSDWQTTRLVIRDANRALQRHF